MPIAMLSRGTLFGEGKCARRCGDGVGGMR